MPPVHPLPPPINGALAIGEPFKVLVAYTTAIIQCQCDAKTVLPLHGKDRITTCPACKRAFTIAGSTSIQIGLVALPTADDLVNQ